MTDTATDAPSELRLEPSVYERPRTCYVCREVIEEYELAASFTDGSGHDVCTECLDGGVDAICARLTSNADWAARMAAALRTDELFTDSADQQEITARELTDYSQARWVLPTPADWAAFHRTTNGDFLETARP